MRALTIVRATHMAARGLFSWQIKGFEGRSAVMVEDEVVVRVCKVLAKYGIPEDAIFCGMAVAVGSKRTYRADVLVAAEDNKTPQLVIEAKGNCARAMAYERAREQTAGLSGRCPCFIATSEGDLIYFARIVGAAISNEEWVQPTDRLRMRQLLGDYSDGSEKAIEQNEPPLTLFSNRQLGQFRIGLAVGGGVAFVAMFIFECVTGRGVSYPLAGVVALIFVLYAASYGLIRELKVKDVGLSFGPWKEKGAKVV